MISTFAAGAGAAEKFRKAIFAATQDTARLTKLQKEFDIQMETVSRKFDILKRTVEIVGIKLFTAFRNQILFVIEAMQGLADALEMAVGVFSKLPDIVKFAIVGFVGLLGAISGLARSSG